MPWLCLELWQGLDNTLLVQWMAGQPRTGRIGVGRDLKTG